MTLKLRDLGTIRCTNGDEEEIILSAPDSTLLLYLASSLQPVSRSALATMMYPNSPSLRQARKNISMMTRRIMATIGEQYFVSNYNQIGLDWTQDIWVDSHTFTRLSEDCERLLRSGNHDTLFILDLFKDVLNLYRNKFAHSAFEFKSELFINWIDEKRIHYSLIFNELVEKAVNISLLSQNEELAQKILNKAVALDPLDESFLILQLQLLYQHNRKNEVRNVASRYRKAIEEKGEQVSNNFDTVLQAMLTAAPYKPHPQLPADVPTTRLPSTTHLTHVYGHERTQERVVQKLLSNSVHLITLVGTGGIGKTTLAKEIGQQIRHAFPHGVHFVSFDGMHTHTESIEQIAHTILLALNIPFTLPDSSSSIVKSYVRSRSMLLILDNFEQLTDTAPWLVSLLQHAPFLKIMVTSQIRLNVSAESVELVEALPLPTRDMSYSEFRSNSCIAILGMRIQQIQPNFVITPENRGPLTEIGRLTGGIPLALVLSAQWINLFSLEEIAASLQYSFQFLTTTSIDRPERQRSLLATLHYSWQLLDKETKKKLAALTIFEGKFHRTDGEAITNINLAQYETLLNRSWLQREDAGWFILHPFIRQYTSQYLEQGEEKELAQKHATHYLKKLSHNESLSLYSNSNIMSDSQTLNSYQQQDANFRKGWVWAYSTHNHQLLQDAAITYGDYLRCTLQRETGLVQLKKAFEIMDSSIPDQRQCAGRLAIYIAEWSSHFHDQIEWGKRATDLLISNSNDDLLYTYYQLMGDHSKDSNDGRARFYREEIIKITGIDYANPYYVDTFATLFLQMAKKGAWQAVKDEVQKIYAETTKHNTLTIPLIITNHYVYLILRDWDGCEQMLDDMKRLIDRNMVEASAAKPFLLTYAKYALLQLNALIRLKDEQYQLIVDEIWPMAKEVEKVDEFSAAFQYLSVVGCFVNLNKLEEAKAVAKTCLKIGQNLSSKDIIAYATLRLGEIALKNGKKDKAISLFQSVYDIGGRIQHTQLLFTSLFYLTILLHPTHSKHDDIVKIAITSPCIDIFSYPFAKTYAAQHQIEVSRSDYDAYYHVNFDDVLALIDFTVVFSHEKT